MVQDAMMQDAKERWREGAKPRRARERLSRDEARRRARLAAWQTPPGIQARFSGVARLNAGHINVATCYKQTFVICFF